jgi:tight adherence protein C
MIIIMFALVFVSTTLLVYFFSSKVVLEGVSLPEGMKEAGEQQVSPPKEILDFTARFTNRFIEKSNSNVMDTLKHRLISAGKPVSIPQFVAFKFLSIVSVPVAVIIALHPEMPFVLGAAAAGFLIPDFWLNSKIAQRRREALRDLPYIIDLLNICVGAGLDFMVAINHVIKEFRPCVVVDEFKTMVKEMQMGLARRDALKNVAKRVSSPEINSFVRTLLQADRMGTPITNALKMHAEELRMIRFAKGEEMALKAPIKLLIPLLLFILPVVMVIVAGPILIQFNSGAMKF